jgi:hypothetical protein
MKFSAGFLQWEPSEASCGYEFNRQTRDVCWQDGAVYDENRYLATLAKRGSPLIPVSAAAATGL